VIVSESAGVRLLVWDDPDIRAGQARVQVAEPLSDVRADLEQVYLWLAGRCRPEDSAEACLFTTVAPGQEAELATAVTDARKQGFAVHARRPEPAETSLHVAMTAMIDALDRSGQLCEVVVASHDDAGLGARLEALAARSVSVVVIGFRELAEGLAHRSGVQFVDIEQIDGAFATPLARTNLYDLPVDGRTLPVLARPTRPAPVVAGSGTAVRRDVSPSSVTTLLTGSTDRPAPPDEPAVTIDLTAVEPVETTGAESPTGDAAVAGVPAERPVAIPPAPPPPPLPPVPPAPRPPQAAVAPWQSSPISTTPKAVPTAPDKDDPDAGNAG